MSVIQDDIGHTVIDETYVAMGKREGWLVLDKWYVDNKGGMVWVYTIK